MCQIFSVGMPLSRAEIQRRYRQRKVENDGKEYSRSKECNRVMKYYTPAESLPASKARERNSDNMLRNRLCRYRKREKLIEAAEVETVSETSGCGIIKNIDDDDEQDEPVQGPSSRSSGAITSLLVKLWMNKCPDKIAGVKKTIKGHSRGRVEK